MKSELMNQHTYTINTQKKTIDIGNSYLSLDAIKPQDWNKTGIWAGTGVGKTTVAIEYMRLKKEEGFRVFFLAPLVSIVEDNMDKMSKDECLTYDRFISLSKDYTQEDWDNTIIIIDEVHHFHSSANFRKVMSRLVPLIYKARSYTVLSATAEGAEVFCEEVIEVTSSRRKRTIDVVYTDKQFIDSYTTDKMILESVSWWLLMVKLYSNATLILRINSKYLIQKHARELEDYLPYINGEKLRVGMYYNTDRSPEDKDRVCQTATMKNNEGQQFHILLTTSRMDEGVSFTRGVDYTGKIMAVCIPTQEGSQVNPMSAIQFMARCRDTFKGDTQESDFLFGRIYTNVSQGEGKFNPKGHVMAVKQFLQEDIWRDSINRISDTRLYGRLQSHLEDLNSTFQELTLEEYINYVGRYANVTHKRWDGGIAHITFGEGEGKKYGHKHHYASIGHNKEVQEVLRDNLSLLEGLSTRDTPEYSSNKYVEYNEVLDEFLQVAKYLQEHPMQITIEDLFKDSKGKVSKLPNTKIVKALSRVIHIRGFYEMTSLTDLSLFKDYIKLTGEFGRENAELTEEGADILQALFYIKGTSRRMKTYIREMIKNQKWNYKWTGKSSQNVKVLV